MWGTRGRGQKVERWVDKRSLRTSPSPPVGHTTQHTHKPKTRTMWAKRRFWSPTILDGVYWGGGRRYWSTTVWLTRPDRTRRGFSCLSIYCYMVSLFDFLRFYVSRKNCANACFFVFVICFWHCGPEGGGLLDQARLKSWLCQNKLPPLLTPHRQHTPPTNFGTLLDFATKSVQMQLPTVNEKCVNRHIWGVKIIHGEKFTKWYCIFVFAPPRIIVFVSALWWLCVTSRSGCWSSYLPVLCGAAGAAISGGGVVACAQPVPALPDLIHISCCLLWSLVALAAVSL